MFDLHFISKCGGIRLSTMATMKEWDDRLKRFWALVFGYGMLAFVVWIGVYALGWGWTAARNVWASPAPTVASASVGLDVPKHEAASKCTMDHRFERTEVYPIGLRADIALDSCSGRLCKTWAWVAKDTKSVWATYQELPVCSELSDFKP
jgi:hypothetical protein